VLSLQCDVTEVRLVLLLLTVLASERRGGLSPRSLPLLPLLRGRRSCAETMRRKGEERAVREPVAGLPLLVAIGVVQVGVEERGAAAGRGEQEWPDEEERVAMDSVMLELGEAGIAMDRFALGVGGRKQ
jgi:hypothetical protein